jgi:hypothetical protein
VVELERVAGKCFGGYGSEEGGCVGEGDAWVTCREETKAKCKGFSTPLRSGRNDEAF